MEKTRNDLKQWTEEVIEAFMATSPENSLADGTQEKAYTLCSWLHESIFSRLC